MTPKAILRILRTVQLLEKGKPVSEDDATYRRGYREAIRRVRDIVEQEDALQEGHGVSGSGTTTPAQAAP